MVEGKRKTVADLVLTGKSFIEAVLEAGYPQDMVMTVASRLERDEEIVEYVKQNRTSQTSTQKAETVPQDTVGEEDDSRDAFIADNPEKFQIGDTNYEDPKLFLKSMMNNRKVEDRLRMDAAKALLPLFHGKVGEMGKKQQKKQAAEEASAGKFSQSAPPSKTPNLKAVK